MQRACVHCPTILPSKVDVRGHAQMQLGVAGLQQATQLQQAARQATPKVSAPLDTLQTRV